MLKNKYLLVITFIGTLLSFCSSSVFANPYLQASSIANQMPNSINSQNVIFESVDESKDLSTRSENQVIVKKPGTYFVMAAAQVGAKDNKAEGYINLWLIKNGKPVFNSNTRQHIANGSTSVLVSQTILTLKAGDAVSAKFSATGRSLGLIAIPATSEEPSIPSIIFSMFMIGN